MSVRNERERERETHTAMFPGASSARARRHAAPRGNTKTIGRLDFSIIVNHAGGTAGTCYNLSRRPDKKMSLHRRPSNLSADQKIALVTRERRHARELFLSRAKNTAIYLGEYIHVGVGN